MKKRCLVTGGNGFIGQHVCAALSAGGYQVRVLDITVASDPLPQVEYFVGSFADPSILDQALRGCDALVHLGWTSLPASSNQTPANDAQINVVGSVRLLEQAVTAGVKQVVFSSSGGTVYGRSEYAPIDEVHLTRPLCAYGVSKLAVEKYLDFFHHHHALRTTSLRIANPYGPGQDHYKRQGVVAVFAQLALQGETAEIWGDGSVVRDFIHIHDVAQAFVSALGDRQTQGVFNIGSGQGTSLEELISAIEHSTQTELKRRYLPARQFDVPVSILDIQKAQRVLGWSPTIALNQGIAETINWLNTQGNA